MRPRVFPAEDAIGPALLVADTTASMRPRVFPAEDVLFCRRIQRMPAGFNEAAGIPRGRRGDLPVQVRVLDLLQ